LIMETVACFLIVADIASAMVGIGVATTCTARS
jgi:hypothetical protein